MTHTCPACNAPASPLENCPRCGEFVAVTITLPPPLSAEIESLRAQLQVARAQTASDRELIVQLREALETIEAQLHATLDAASADGRPNHIYKGPIEAQMLNARAVLGKVSP